jgi:D-alanyl-D-alanine carboxypeptidase
LTTVNDLKFLRMLFILLIPAIIFSTKNIVFAGPINPSADSAVLIDATTGTVLFEKNKDTAYPPASTTKIMTALLTLEKTNLDDDVVISNDVPEVEGSAVGLKEGEIFSVEDLLYGLMLESGNDCATALAEHISGSTQNFAALMNSRAKELGCQNTNFANPHGLFDKTHKISSYDMALIMRELIKYPEYKKIATTVTHKINPTNKCNEVRYVNNSNRLVLNNSSGYYKYCIGGKTGYTIDSLHSYVGAATKDGHTLILALLHDGAKTYFEDSVSLFEYGFNNFKLNKYIEKGTQISSFETSDEKVIPLVAKNDFYYIEENNKPLTLSTESNTKDLNLDYSFKKGQVLSVATIKSNNSILGTVELVSDVDYSPPITTYLANSDITNSKNTYIAIMTSFIVGVLAVLYIKNVLKKKKLKRKYSELTSEIASTTYDDDDKI